MLSRVLSSVFLLLGVVACVLLFAPNPAAGQIVAFNQIDQSDGLRNGNVRAILKDYQGFMWFGTEDGLHRYDGQSMKVYRKDENDSTSISSNFILCLFEDSKDRLWIGTMDGGLCVYDRTFDHFIRFPNGGATPNKKTDNAVRVIYENVSGEIFVGGGQLLRGRIQDDVRATRFQPVELLIDTVRTVGLRIMDIAAYQDSLLLLGVNNFGLYIYNPASGHFYQHPMSCIEKNIQAIHVDDKRKLIWAGTWKNGLLVTDYSGKRCRYIVSGNDKHSIRNNYVPKLAGDLAGNLWIGTDHGLSTISPTSDPFNEPIVHTYLPEPQNQSSIQGSIIKAVYIDPEDNLWVGAYYNGVCLYNKGSTHFGTITLPEGDGTKLPGFRSVSAIVEDKRNNLWLGTDGSGLFVSHDTLSMGPPKFTNIKLCRGIEKIKCMALDQHDNLWIGTWGAGLFVFNTNSYQCRNFSDIKTGTNIGTEITSLEIDRAGAVWIGTFDNGIFRFNPEDKSIVHLKNTAELPNYIDRINVVQSGNADDIWIAREAGGLSRSSVRGSTYEIITTQHVKSSTTVTSVYVGKDDVLWLGCPSKGLIQLDLKNNTSLLYTEQDGLGNSMIYAILEDEKGRLWLSTDAGLTLFNKSTGRFLNFGLANGLLSNQFNKASALLSRSGYLVFGNINGANYVPPDALASPMTGTPVIFTKLFVNNREQQVGKGSVLGTNILVTRTIELDHAQNSFAVEVASLEYDFSRQQEYYYKLENFNETWQYSGSQPLIQYTNLEPGRYLLKVSTSPPENSRVEPDAVLEVVIKPAWWQTTTFRFASVIGVILLAIGIHRFRIRYLLGQKTLLEQQVNQRTEKLNQINQLLKSKLDEINELYDILKRQQLEIIEKNNEIQAQNEELTSQNEHIATQHETLISAQDQLREINQSLEKAVDERTSALKQTIDDLNKTVFELDRFVYSASHDLSAPLKSILGLVQIINLEQDRSKIISYANLIKASVQKLEDVIKSMVDYARNSHVQVSTVEFSLAEAVDEVFRDLRFLPGATGVVLENHIGAELHLNNDPSRIKVILNNLIGNCIKYIDKNKAMNFVTIKAVRAGSETTITIVDNGIGIRPEFLDKIFNMYFRGTETSKGSGLGLFIVKETVNKLGGQVSVRSVIGEGSTFVVSIPDVIVTDK